MDLKGVVSSRLALFGSTEDVEEWASQKNFKRGIVYNLDLKLHCD